MAGVGGGEPDVAAHSWEQSAPSSYVGSPRPPGLGCPFVSPRLWPSGSGRRPPPYRGRSVSRGKGEPPPRPDAPTRAPPNFPKLGSPSKRLPPSAVLATAQMALGSGSLAAGPRTGVLRSPHHSTPHRGSLSGPRRSGRQARAYLVGSLRRPIRVRPRSRPSALSEPSSGPPTARRPPSNPGAAGS